jgi:succinate-semialdehyde dehydrogenase/glutarate-semialdehyde dehydrogenase
MPWVLTDIPPASPAATEELFGPVASIFAVPDAEAAITLANATRFGLGTSIWTSDLDRAVTIASQIEAGTIAINQMVASDPRLPFGGVKHSGFGRELGLEGFLEFSNIQSITLPSPT